MGLAAPRQRTKIGADPNNTKWAKSTDRFGHKILTAQGWKPGDTLGAENASHASHYTAASASHIRVLLREDNLGLGAKNGKQDSDNFGLDMFQGLLGRLNGKSDEVLKKEEGYRRDLRLKEMVVKRFGGTTFVSGGFLVGDRMERTTPITSHATDVAGAKRKEKKSKKRKRVDAGDNGATAEDTKREKLSESSEEDILERERRKAKKEKKLKTNVVPQIVAEEEGIDGLNPTAADSQAETAGPSEKELKRQRKMERKAAKEAKRREKGDGKRRKREHELKDEDTTVSSSPIDTSEAEVASSAPVYTLQKTAAVARGRFAVRSRYSQQKRLAVADQQALKEIFMIKAEA